MILDPIANGHDCSEAWNELSNRPLDQDNAMTHWLFMGKKGMWTDQPTHYNSKKPQPCRERYCLRLAHNRTSRQIN